MARCQYLDMQGTFLALVATFLLSCSAMTGARGAPVLPTDVFKSPCGAFLPDPPPGGFKLWSSPSTWPGGKVPGVGPTAGTNVTIPCGTSVLLNVPKVELGLLRVMGHLKFLDDPKLKAVTLSAHFVLVEGRFTVGTEAKQFSQRVTIVLTPNVESGRASYKYSLNAPADALFPRDLGHKAFAVVGGQVNFHGLPGPRNMPVWCKLAATAKAGDAKLTLDTDVSAIWPAGFEIGIASTDYSNRQEERFIIESVTKAGTGSVVQLNKPLAYMHWGDKNLPNGAGGQLDQRAEVALLTRNIVMTGTNEPAPYDLEGGHFIIFQTYVPQYIEGLQSVGMGQQGNLGRYPIHLHLHGNQKGGTYVRKNSIVDSKQRCVVIHATFNVTVFDNVAFNTFGHCFLVEEGGETGNVFEHNLGIKIKAVSKLISADETDNQPSAFWITNMNNRYINNVAAGSDHSGFWFELREEVRGLSLKFALVNGTNPFFTILAGFSGNTAHSCDTGVRTYPHGNRPRLDNRWGSKYGLTTVSKLNAYKNRGFGMFIHNTDRLVITDSQFADNDMGVMMNQDETITVQLSAFVALSNNLGNPTPGACQSASTSIWTGCQTSNGCNPPVAAGQQGRSVADWRGKPLLGVGIDQGNRSESGLFPNIVRSSSFSFYDATCRPAAAVALMGEGRGDFFNPSHSVTGLKFDAVSNRVWAFPKLTVLSGSMVPGDGGEQSQFYALRDLDGSILGKPGFVMANNPSILPLAPAACTFRKSWNAYSCPGTCYRTVQVDYVEPAFKHVGGHASGEYSQVQIKRVADGKTFTLDGNLQQTGEYGQTSANQRFFTATLLGGLTYEVVIKPGSDAPKFYPTAVGVKFKDAGGCGQGLTLRLAAPSGKQWNVLASNAAVPSPCPGVAPLPPTVATWQLNCQTRTQEVALGAAFAGALALSLAPSTCSATSKTCGLVPSGSSWLYDASGTDLVAKFKNPAFSTAGWKTGAAVFGYLGYSNWIATVLPLPTKMVYYFRKSFTVKSSACFSGLNLEWAVSDGAVFYLNNKEIGRYNMPAGPVVFGTKALKPVPFLSADQSHLLWNAASLASSLVEGSNLLAVEVHSFQTYAWMLGFDLRLTAQVRTDSCKLSVSSAPEICDGVDNDNDGKVDEGADGKPLTQACQTACGTGVATCVGGEWAGCTAKAPSEEKCNGKDDDCDGRVDNGLGQLDCAAGQGCFQGQCLPVGALTSPTPEWGQNSSGWRYYGQGGDLDAISPAWRKGGAAVAGWEVGAAPLGYDQYVLTDTFATALPLIQGKFVTHYLAKPFTLTAAEVANTFSIDLNVRKDDGVVVYLNGAEVMRSNMPAGAVKFDTMAPLITQAVGNWNSKWAYVACSQCTHSTAKYLQAGTNWITAELHQAYLWSGDAAFDMDLSRNEYKACKSLPGAPSACIRSPPPSTLIQSESVWKYNDASVPLPPGKTWMQPAFDDSAWKSGKGYLGYGVNGGISTRISNETAGNGRRAYYFRRVFTALDGPCYFDLTCSLLANDGAVVYLNGREVYRQQMPVGPVSSDTSASSWGTWARKDTRISGGWLKAGENLMAVEVHQMKGSTANGFFDAALTGLREGATCLPAPL